MISRKENDIELQWTGPLLYTDDELFAATLPGLYLFTLPVNGRNYLQYVGKTNGALTDRVVGGHFRDAISGRYYLYDPQKASELQLDVKYYLKDTFAHFFKNLQALQELARNNLEMTRIFLCPFQSDSDIIVDIESVLIHHAFSASEEVRKRDFPVLENSKRVSRSIYGSKYRVTNKFREGVVVPGLNTTILAPEA